MLEDRVKTQSSESCTDVYGLLACSCFQTCSTYSTARKVCFSILINSETSVTVRLMLDFLHVACFDKHTTPPQFLSFSTHGLISIYPLWRSGNLSQGVYLHMS